MVKWTDAEDNILLACIANNKKRKDAYAEAIKSLTNRSERACLDRWILLKNRTPVDMGVVQDAVYSEEAILEEVIDQQPVVTSVEEKTSEVDIVAEIQKVLNVSSTNKEENEKLIKENKRLDGENFELKFLVTQLQNKNENLELQLNGLDELIQKSTEEHYAYIAKIENLNKAINEKDALIARLEGRIKDKDAVIAEHKRLHEVLKAEKAEAEKDNNIFMHFMNKARQKITGTDKVKTAEFRMEQNGNLERVR